MKNAFVAAVCILTICACRKGADLDAAAPKLAEYRQANVDDCHALAALTEGFTLSLEQELSFNPLPYIGFVTITSTPQQKYPKIIRFEFKDTVCSDGLVRSGKITAKFDTVPWQKDTITLTYNSYKVNGVSFTGTQTICITDASATHEATATTINSLSFTSLVENAYLLEVVGGSTGRARWGGQHSWEWTPSQAVIAGSGSGATRLGFSYQTLITKELEKNTGCQYVAYGEVAILARGDTALVDFSFGGGGCNNLLLLTHGTEEVELKLPF